ncbi:LysR family transcriptional regulator, partial [Acinetobacter baumannii]
FWQLTRPLYMLVHRQKYQGPGLKAFLKFCDEDQA